MIFLLTKMNLLNCADIDKYYFDSIAADVEHYNSHDIKVDECRLYF